MKYPTVRFVFDRKKTATDKKKGLVQIEVLHLRKRKYFSTGVKVYPNQWNDKKMVVSRIDSEELNIMLNNMLLKIRKYIISIQDRDVPFSFDDLGNYISGNPGGNDSFIEFYYERIKSRKLKESTKKSHLVAY